MADQTVLVIIQQPGAVGLPMTLLTFGDHPMLHMTLSAIDLTVPARVTLPGGVDLIVTAAAGSGFGIPCKGDL